MDVYVYLRVYIYIYIYIYALKGREIMASPSLPGGRRGGRRSGSGGILWWGFCRVLQHEVNNMFAYSARKQQTGGSRVVFDGDPLMSEKRTL